MHRLDVVERLPALSLLAGGRGPKTPQELLKEAGIIGDGKKAYYTSYGRAALQRLFSEKFRGEKIAFPAFVCPYIIDAAARGGAEPVLVDADIRTFNMDAGSIPKDCGNVFAVHTFGNPMDLRQLKDKTIIEDCAHALFAQANGRYVGDSGDYVLFSLYKQTPNICGAMLLSKDELGLQGLKGEHLPWMRLIPSSKEFGFFSDIVRARRPLPESKNTEAAAEAPDGRAFRLFAEGFGRLREEVEGRNRLAEHYRKRVEESTFLRTQETASGGRHSYYNFSVRLTEGGRRERDLLLLQLRKEKIFCDRMWYDAPAGKNGCPNALKLSDSVINLPIRAAYGPADVDRLFDRIEACWRKVK